MDSRPLLSVRDLKTHFVSDEGTIRAVDGVSFDVYGGRTLGIVGETGCGKSVTARSILRIVDKPGRVVGGQILLRRDGGSVDLATLAPNGPQMRAVRGGEIGLVFQEPMTSFSPVHTVGNQLVEAVRLHRPAGTSTDRAVLRQRAVELLDMVGVPHPEQRLDAYPWQLSGGLLQRAMIAMALAGSPRLLILDEPTTALDVITQAQILDLVSDLQERTGLAMMLITHDLGVVAQLADDVAVMYLGRVVERGPATEIFSAPRHPYTQALLRSIPSLYADRRVKLPNIAGSIPHPFDRPAGCAFNPRCTHVVPGLCDQQEPAPQMVGLDREVLCHLTDLPAFVPLPGAISGTGNGHGRLRVIELDCGTGDGPAGPPALLEVTHLSKRYAVQGHRLGRSRGTVQAVDDVSFDLRAGETFALVGESGSGKTTASRCVLRAVTPDAGSILFRTRSGQTVDLATLPAKQLRPLRADIQMIFQDPYSSLNPRMTILDIIGEPLLLNGMGRQERTDRAAELLRLVGLRPEYLHRFPHAFSGGQRQRIGIARALALHPRLVVADEPVSALDVSVQAQTLNLLVELQEQLGLTYLFVSHDLSVVRHISDRIGVMYAGQLVEIGDTAGVLAEPAHPYTAALLAAVPKPDPRHRARFNIPRAKTPPTSEPPPGCHFQRRCPLAVERCQIERPALTELVSGRVVRCHLAGELSLAGSSPRG